MFNFLNFYSYLKFRVELNKKLIIGPGYIWILMQIKFMTIIKILNNITLKKIEFSSLCREYIFFGDVVHDYNLKRKKYKKNLKICAIIPFENWIKWKFNEKCMIKMEFCRYYV